MTCLLLSLVLVLWPCDKALFRRLTPVVQLFVLLSASGPSTEGVLSCSGDKYKY